jgi:hypothetical protein
VSQEIREETVRRIPNTKKWKLLKGKPMLLSQDLSNSEHKVADGRQSGKERRKDASACLITSILQ